jgi:hypothetical protein
VYRDVCSRQQSVGKLGELAGGTEPLLPAVNEVRDRVMLAEGGHIEAHANLHIVPCRDAHSSLIFILKSLPL